jgi:hydroxypyruvate isomerase
LNPVICFEMLFPDLDPAEKIRKIAGQGFEFVEFWGWRHKDIPALAAACGREGVRVANFSGHRRGSLVAEQTHDLFLEDLQAAVATARILECGTLMLLSNELTESGAVADSYPGIPSEQKYRNAQEGLRKALEVLPPDLRLVLEPLNTRIDHPGYWLSDMDAAVKLIRDIGDSRLKVLCDLYHLGVMGVDLGGILKEHARDIGYIHIADIPGRHEPGTGTVDWKGVLGQLQAARYEGFVGFEYSPQGDSAQSLRQIRSLWDNLFGNF